MKPPEVPDPLAPEQLKKLAPRLGLPLAAVWLLGGLIAAVSHSGWAQGLALGIPALVTVALVGVVVWAFRQAKKARGVASLLRGVETAEGRRAALAELEAGYAKDDPAAVFARAQLEMQEEPRKALQTLERIDLTKVMATVADEARAQRAMIHLVLGEVARARELVENIKLDRHQEQRTRAMLAAVVAEAWARGGQAKRAKETLELFDAEDDAYEALRPQLYRARAYACIQLGDEKGMRRALRRMLEIDPRLLGPFLQPKTHPLLAKEARKLVERSGVVPRKMVVQRR